MRSPWIHAAGALVLADRTTAVGTKKDFTEYVNLFIGTEGPVSGTAYSAGNVFPGASLPFGAVKVGIDTTRFVAFYPRTTSVLLTSRIDGMSHVSGDT